MSKIARYKKAHRQEWKEAGKAARRKKPLDEAAVDVSRFGYGPIIYPRPRSYRQGVILKSVLDMAQLRGK